MLDCWFHSRQQRFNAFDLTAGEKSCQTSVHLEPDLMNNYFLSAKSSLRTSQARTLQADCLAKLKHVPFWWQILVLLEAESSGLSLDFLP
jgi:hypothetical protein